MRRRCLTLRLPVLSLNGHRRTLPRASSDRQISDTRWGAAPPHILSRKGAAQAPTKDIVRVNQTATTDTISSLSRICCN